MKKIIFVIILLIPLNVFAYTGPLDPDSFYINNMTNTPFHITIGSNSSTTATLHLVWDYNHAVTSTLDLPGSYLFFSIVSDKKIDINRNATFGSSCNNSCFSNDDYLQLVDDTNGYSYVYYFNILKWQRTVGTQVDLFNVDDVFKFTNLESGSANVYIYGTFADNTNQIPQYINDVQTKQEIIIGQERMTSEIINNQNDLLGNDCPNLIYDVKHPSDTILDFYFDKPDTKTLTFQFITNVDLQNNSLYFRNGNTNVRIVATLTGSANTLIKATFTFTDNEYNFLQDTGNVLRVYKAGALFNLPTLYQLEEGSTASNICKYGSTISKIDDTNDKIDDVNNSINDLNDNIISNDIDNPNSDFSEMEDMIAHNGVITNLIALPITLYSSILNGLNQSCSTYSFGNLFGTDLKFQCINLGALLGNTIWGVIDVLFSGFTIYAIAKKMIKVFNNFSGLQEGDVIDD